MSAYVCDFCGGEHEEGPKPPPTAWLSVPIKTCPAIPRDHFYLHDEPEGKPPGTLVKIPKVPMPDNPPYRNPKRRLR